jgi:hypothetical protein
MEHAASWDTMGSRRAGINALTGGRQCLRVLSVHERVQIVVSSALVADWKTQ